LSFDFGPQARFVLSAETCLRFGLPAGVFFGAASLGFISDALRVNCGSNPGLFTRRYVLDLFFDSAKTRFRTTSQFVFLRPLAGLGLEKLTFFFSPAAGILLFDLAQGRQFGFMSGERGGNLFVKVLPPVLFHAAHSFELLLGMGDFLIGNLPAFVFLGTFAGFSFDPLSFLLGAAAGYFFFVLAPAFLFDAQGILSREALGFEFGATGFFVNPQAAQFNLQLCDLFSITIGYGR
jgi:hypothetical protein